MSTVDVFISVYFIDTRRTRICYCVLDASSVLIELPVRLIFFLNTCASLRVSTRAYYWRNWRASMKNFFFVARLGRRRRLRLKAPPQGAIILQSCERRLRHNNIILSYCTQALKRYVNRVSRIFFKRVRKRG